MKILVTGGAGFIGSHLVESYQGEAEIRVLDNLRTGSWENLEGLEYERFEGSIADTKMLQEALEGVNIVFHLAAFVSVPESVASPVECVDINVKQTLQLLQAASQADVQRFVFASSAAVYGDDPVVPKLEGMVPQPMSPYAVTKLDGEYYCDLWLREWGLSTVALRFFNVFGERQDPDSPYAAAVPIFIERAKSNSPIKIFGDGEQTRDFIYVKDIVEGLRFVAANKAMAGPYNIGYGRSITINELVEQIKTSLGSHSPIEYAPVRSGDVKHSRASAARLVESGWQPRYGFEDGLKRTLG